MNILADVGGRPGHDCRGFCAYCYFKGAKLTEPFGCRHCLPFKKGCAYCESSIIERYPSFKPLEMVVSEVNRTLRTAPSVEKFTISGGGDLSCYPALFTLTELMGELDIPIHLGYTSGKGFDDVSCAERLISHGVSEVSFTVFSTEPALRKRWMGDQSPSASIECLERFSQSCDVYAASVLIPGVNDGAELYRTCERLEEMGVAGLILMRFANEPSQGLILNNAPILPGIIPHTVEQFRDIVLDVARQFSFRVVGTPLLDAQVGSPFSILEDEEMLRSLPKVRKGATLITGRVARPMLAALFELLGAEEVNVVGVDVDIADLITARDLARVNLSELKETVIVPGRVLVHDAELKRMLCADGVDRLIRRGPDKLTLDGEMSISMTKEEVLAFEREQLCELISLINAVGV
ncbi:MAG: [methyl coenzyme reductase]-L-arginine C-5-methyltransferase [Methanosarcinales archaeon]|nr:methyl coenzyme M reductase-arginine methyltransferase Mmp10 [Methermicoccus shengliensis]KUK03897.1 MAG: Putative methanogenesis marker protein 10 [Euryarchaeota archaeon 55_53]KUK29469.1 MAG: Putative methanogenesis marker protein 10 [Methanosarcinales archeaon 56_1174]MDI3488695.1 [methyl coenzyme reductase]-L-arginine C-5-methyltransferase [Methanosarcinales archaeon]MDN5295874.1 [methyl coenzyme reductase]-L-arginine C-5-methyltransferase [Methanosarcinales archaeon]